MMSHDLAPVVVYTYSRISHLRRTLSALRNNPLAGRTVLYVISDAAVCAEHKPLVNEVREYVESVNGFREVVKVFRDRNMGTPASALEAEGRVVSDHGSVISMEDDNVSSSNFLNFMNDGLRAYDHDPAVYSICGYCPPITIPLGFAAEYWFYPWNLSWGYATWKAKYDGVHPLVNRYRQFRREGLLRKLRQAGGLYIVDALQRDFRKKASFLDAVLCAEMTRAGLHSVIPAISKINNIGCDGSGVSSGRFSNRFEVGLDHRGAIDFSFAGRPEMNQRLVLETIRFYSGSLFTRASMRLGIYHELSLLKKRLAGR